MNFALPAHDKVKVKEIEKRNKYQDLAIELKKLWNMKVRMIPTVIYTGIGGLRNKRINGNSPNYCIIKIGQNPEESPGKIAITENHVKNHQLTLV